MGDLTMPRKAAAVVTLNFVGVFIIGGDASNNARTSEFLAAGSMQWQEGPTLPVEMRNPCAIPITSTSFLAIYGTDIREFDAAIAGAISDDGWWEYGHWPELKTSRTYHPGCAKIGQKVIIAGGYNDGGSLSSTEVLNLIDRRIFSGGELAMPRRDFHVATIISGGEEKMFALAGYYEPKGYYDGNYLDTVEEWVEANSTWKAADSLAEKRYFFGGVAVPKKLHMPSEHRRLN